MEISKLIIRLILSLSLLFNFTAIAQNEISGKIWGKLIEKKTKSKHKNINDYKYYLEIKKDKEIQVFPLVALKKEDIEKLKNNVNKTIRVSGKLIGRKIYVDRQPVVYYEMQADQVLAISLKDLMPTQNPDVKIIKRPRSVGVSGGIEVDDDVANAAILGAGAALIYSILKK